MVVRNIMGTDAQSGEEVVVEEKEEEECMCDVVQWCLSKLGPQK